MDFVALSKFMLNHLQLLLINSFFVQHALKFEVQALKYFALVDNRVEWIPHFVRNCGVDQGQKLSLSFRRIIHYLLGDICKGDHCFLLLPSEHFDPAFSDFEIFEFE